MTSWRDGATQQCQDDLDGLLDVTLPMAQQMLAKSGEFYPFGAAVTVSGETQWFGADPGQGEHPASGDVRTLLLDGMHQNRERFRAIAVCSDVRIPDSDAIRVELEHRDGQVMAVVLPYKKKRLGRGIEYQQLRAETTDKTVWALFTVADCAEIVRDPVVQQQAGPSRIRCEQP